MLSESDVTSLVAYMRSAPAVEKPNGPVELGPLGKVLFVTGEAATLIPATVIAHDEPFPVKPAEATTPDFGKYLVSTACSGCHGPNLSGGPIPGGDPAWPPASDLTVFGNGQASKEDFIRAMRQGIGRSGNRLAVPMPVELTAQLNDQELDSMWLYLTNLKQAASH